MLVPNATMHAPVRVATSMMASAPQFFSAYTRASANVSLPSASVFSTCRITYHSSRTVETHHRKTVWKQTKVVLKQRNGPFWHVYIVLVDKS